MKLGAKLLRADGQLAFHGVAHEDHRFDFGAQNIFIGCDRFWDNADVFGTNDDDDVFTLGDFIRQDAA